MKCCQKKILSLSASVPFSSGKTTKKLRSCNFALILAAVQCGTPIKWDFHWRAQCATIAIHVYSSPRSDGMSLSRERNQGGCQPKHCEQSLSVAAHCSSVKERCRKAKLVLFFRVSMTLIGRLVFYVFYIFGEMCNYK